ncbi:hypothetical protein NE399_02130, partial [Streptomyces sp. Isolate_219]|nr:hypothetical protein [Streptomyces sp. Isolate_219]
PPRTARASPASSAAPTRASRPAGLLAAALALVRSRTLDALPAMVSRPAAGAYADALTGPLRTGVWLVIGAGTLTAALAAAGPPALRALRARRLAARTGAGP